MTEEEEHTGQHTDCPPCYKIKLHSVQFQGIDAHEHRVIDSTRARDMAIYPQLRREGLQPPHVFGSAEVAAQAESRFEIEHATVMSPTVRKEFLPKLADSGAKV